MKTFLEMKAGEQREFLARELADWIRAGFISSSKADSYYRRAKIPARRVGETVEEVMESLNADADAIVKVHADASHSAPEAAS